jgi:hypothetical protein
MANFNWLKTNIDSIIMDGASFSDNENYNAPTKKNAGGGGGGNENKGNVSNKKSSGGSQVKRAREAYGLPPQEGGKIPLATFTTPFPIFYKGARFKNLQKCTNLSTNKKEDKKLSSMTWSPTEKKWTDNETGIKYKSPLDKDIVTFKVHKDEQKSLEKAFKDILNAYGLEKVYELGLCCCSGTYVARNTRGGNSYSMHSWGIAIDLLAGENPNTHTKSATFRKPEYNKFLDIMEANGWYSGGRAWDRDYMHFQTVKP